MLTETLIYLFVFIFGLCIGSFLNCVVFRLEQKEKLSGRSKCPHCKATLLWKDLFPVFSFLLLLGKCRYCSKKISIQYPVVEIATGLMFLVVFWVFGFGIGIHGFINFVLLLYVLSVLIIVFVYDFKYYLIPDKVLLPAIVITLLYRISSLSLSINYIVASAVAAGFFLAIFLISSGRWMGFGDVKLAVLMGLLLGFPNVLVALFLAFFFGAIIGVMTMIYKKKSLKSEMPFAPFLITGTFVALLWGTQLAGWYSNLFLN